MKQVRRKVVSGHSSGGWNSNYYRVTMSCGHTGTAQGRRKTNAMFSTTPETSVCCECSKLATEKENAK